MPVIGDCEFKFRVNVTRTNGGFAQENYGLFHDLSAILPRRVACGPRVAVLNFAE